MIWRFECRICQSKAYSNGAHGPYWEEEEEEEEEESKKNFKIPKLIFTIDISNFPSTIIPTFWFLGGAESAPPPPFSVNFGARPEKG